MDITVSTMKNLSLDTLIEAYNDVYRIEGTADIHLPIETTDLPDLPIKNIEPILEALGICPTATKAVGQTVTLSAITTGGTAPYRVWFYKGGTPLNPNGISNVAEGATASFTYILSNTDGGSQTFSVAITDSCSSGAMTASDQCDITVAEPPATAGISPILVLGLAVGLLFMATKKKI